jgi:hypothetical protein
MNRRGAFCRLLAPESTKEAVKGRERGKTGVIAGVFNAFSANIETGIPSLPLNTNSSRLHACQRFMAG